MKRDKILFHIDRKGTYLSLDSLPAWVCQQCGERYFEESEVDSIQTIIKAVEKQAVKFAKTA